MMLSDRQAGLAALGMPRAQVFRHPDRITNLI
jgi:hypothetical protein